MTTKINPGACYMIEGADLLRIQAATSRLYSETRLSGEEMRDLAQSLDGIARNAIEAPAEDTRGATCDDCGGDIPGPEVETVTLYVCRACAKGRDSVVI